MRDEKDCPISHALTFPRIHRAPALSSRAAAHAMAAPPPELPPVLILSQLFPFFHDALCTRFRFLKPWDSPLPADDFLAAQAAEARVLLCCGPFPTIDAAIIARLPRLELVVASSVGVDHIDVDECRRRGVAVTNIGDVFSDDVADYAVGLLINVLRKVSAADRYVRHGLWPVNGEFPLGSKLGGKRIGIVGLGSIGSRVAKRLEAFGCVILYHSRAKKSCCLYQYFSNVFDLATESDVLVCTCALTEETHHIINSDVMLALGKKGIVINVGRGALIDEKELVRCLTEGKIGGAGLDVFEVEPNVPEELFQMDNVVLSHHIAPLTPEASSSVIQVVIDNLEAFFSNRPLITPV